MQEPSGIIGIGGKPYLNLDSYIESSDFSLINDEICLGLARVETGAAGGKHKTWRIVPESVLADGYNDYGQIIASFTDQEYARFISLADSPEKYDVAKRSVYDFGEGSEDRLSKAQCRYLEFRYKVYFPWRTCYSFLGGAHYNWFSKDRAEGKFFKPEAELIFPRTVAFIRSLPFKEIGRVHLLGLGAHDHANIHRDQNPQTYKKLDEFISFCPEGNKRLFVWNEASEQKTYLTSKVYWFNNVDYHGVEADPFFRYSIRVDGVFTESFRKKIAQENSDIQLPFSI